MKINNTIFPGVAMGKNFIENLFAPLELKPFVENESRLEDGKRIVLINPKKVSREITLEFQITGYSRANYESNKAALLSAFYGGEVTIQLENGESQELSNMKFHLIYLGKSPTYDTGLSGQAGRISVRFLEPNPGNRS